MKPRPGSSRLDDCVPDLLTSVEDRPVSQGEYHEFLDEPLADRSPRRGFAKTAWAVVVLLVSVSVFLQGHRGDEGVRESQNAVQQSVLDLQGQYLVAASQMPGIQKKQLYESAKTLSTGPLFMRLRFVVLAGELVGPDEAIKQANAVQEKMAEPDARVSEQDQRVVTVLRRLYSDYEEGQWDAPSVESGEHQLLRDELGWFGALALSPERSAADESESSSVDPARAEVLAAAQRTFVVVVLTTFLMLGAGFVGLAGAVTFLVLVVTRKVRSSILTGWGNSAIYAETFAVWMLLFLALTVAAAFVVREFPDSQLLVSSVASLLSLGALIWPTMRGIPWNQARRDIGLFAGKKPIREVFWGVVCYVSNLPVLVLGLLATLALLALYSAVAGGSSGFEPADAPTHPVIEWARDAGWGGRIHIFLLACVFAPLIEETVFRGVLYRHLREGTARWRTGASIIFSVGFNSFIFAVIHPQGLIAAPALMSVAAGLSLAREWRGSLLAPMTMHATNNGVLILLLFLLL